MTTERREPPATTIDRFYFDQAARYQREAVEFRGQLDRLQAENTMIVERYASLEAEAGNWRNAYAAIADHLAGLRMATGDLLAARAGKVGAHAGDQAAARAALLLTDEGAHVEARRRRAVVDAAERLPFELLSHVLMRASAAGIVPTAVTNIPIGRLIDLSRAVADLKPLAVGFDGDLAGMVRIVGAASELPLRDLHESARARGDEHQAERIHALAAALDAFIGAATFGQAPTIPQPAPAAPPP